jgi:hypothetical protein
MRYNIKVNIKQLECEDVKWIQLVQNRVERWALVYMVTNFWVP